MFYSVDLEKVIEGVERNLWSEFLDVNGSLPEYERRAGGYFCLSTVCYSNAPLRVMMVGDPPADKRAKYFELCIEKANRLIANGLGPQQHKLSWQSRNEAYDQWGGAVRWGDYVFSFSGLPELADEALMLYLLYTAHGWGGVSSHPSDVDLARLGSISGNPHFHLTPRV